MKAVITTSPYYVNAQGQGEAFTHTPPPRPERRVALTSLLTDFELHSHGLTHVTASRVVCDCAFQTQSPEYFLKMGNIIFKNQLLLKYLRNPFKKSFFTAILRLKMVASWAMNTPLTTFQLKNL